MAFNRVHIKYFDTSNSILHFKRVRVLRSSFYGVLLKEMDGLEFSRNIMLRSKTYKRQKDYFQRVKCIP